MLKQERGVWILKMLGTIACPRDVAASVHETGRSRF